MWTCVKICAKLWREVKRGTMKVITQLHMINLLIKIDGFNWDNWILFIIYLYNI